MDPITIAIGAAAAVTIVIVRKVRAKKRLDAEKDAFINALIEENMFVKEQGKALAQVVAQNATAYMKEAPDTILEQKCANVLKDFFPDGIEARFNTLRTEESKEKLVKDLISKLKDVMGVGLNAVIFKNLDATDRGVYQYMDEEYGKTITLNKIYLSENPVELISTVIHEMKHAVQFEAIFEGNKLGYSDQRLAQWLRCIGKDSYVKGDYCYEAYALQAVELDANIFVDGVMEEFGKCN